MAASIAAAATLSALVVVEAGLRLANYPPAPPVGWQWEGSPYRNQRDTGTNQLGLRGRPIEYGPDDFVVVLVGDSQVEAGARPAEMMPERVLERVLRDEFGIARARVVSVASAGWGTDQEYVNLQNYFKHYRADLVLLWFTAVNDFWENGFIDRSVQRSAGHFKPTFAIDPDGKLVPHRVVPLTKIGLALELALARRSGLDYPNWRLQRWLQRIPAGPAPQAGVGAVCPKATIEEAHMWDYQGQSPLTVVADEDIENNRTHFSPLGSPLSPRERYQIDVTRLLLAQVDAEVRAHGARFRFFYPRRPDLDGVLSRVACVRSTLTGTTRAIDGSDLIRPLDTPQLRPLRIVYSLPSTGDLAIGNGDVHHSDNGNRLAMRGLAQNLARQGLLAAGGPGTGSAK